MPETITIAFQGGPMDSESRDFPKDKIPRVIETLVFGKQSSAGQQKVGRYELHYVFVGDTISEERFPKS